jgi:uncharacterized protein (TIGR02145 family)
MLLAGIYPEVKCYTLSGSDTGFIENKGQITDQHYKPNPDVLYLLNTPGLNVQLRKTGFSYDVYRISDVEQTKANVEQNHHNIHSRRSGNEYTESTIQFHRIDINLEGANPGCQIIPSEQQPDFLNYFKTSAPTLGIKNVRQYGKITYKNIYPGIDLDFFTDKDHGYKYNFVIYPGAHINDIRLRIEGPEHISLIRDTLIFRTIFGDIEELIPESYYMVIDLKIYLRADFKKINDEVYGFSVYKTIPENSLMVIDPTSIRLWGTYYGGSDVEGSGGWGSDLCSADKTGNVFLAGTTHSINNIASAGSYQSTLVGVTDGFLAKFNAAGQRQWGTYFGGGSEVVYSCTTDKSGNIYVSGDTESLSGIASDGAHQTVHGPGNLVCFIEKFDQAGERLWGTYYGGANYTEGGNVTTDKNGNVFLSGCTTSDIAIATAGSYQPNIYNTVSDDAFLAKFDSNGVRQWGTYYGGEQDEYSAYCITDISDDIYICGGTFSDTNITSEGAHQTIHGGAYDGLLVKFTNGGQRIWATYYGGNGDDNGNGCTIDSTGNIYVVGSTDSPNNIASPGCYQPALAGFGSGFIVKFDSSGQRQWGTYYGGTGWLNEVTSCATGWNNAIFITGNTTSTDSISTPDSYQPVFNGGSNGFIVKFNAGGQRQWGTYYGGNSATKIASCRYLSDDTIYVSGWTYSTSNIASPGAWQSAFGGATDAMLIKFLDCWHIDTAGPITGPVTVCKPLTGLGYSIPSLAHAVNYVWTLPPGFTLTAGAGSPAITVNISNSAVSGMIRVKGLNKCGDAGDSAALSVTVSQAAVPALTGPDTTCAGPGKVYSTDPGKTNYQWSTSPGGVVTSGGSTNIATVSWNAPGIQQVFVIYTDTNGCQAPAPTQYNVLVNADSVVIVSISASLNNVCSGTPVIFTATSLHGGTSPSYQWKVNGTNSGTNSSVFTYTPLNNDVINCVLTSSIPICTVNNPATSNSITMIVYPSLPVSISITSSNNPVCAGNSVIFTATPLNEGTSPFYQWKVNGLNQGTDSTNYSYTPQTGDSIRCIITSSNACATNNPASSNKIIMSILPVPVVSFTLCFDSITTIAAVPFNLKGGIPLGGTYSGPGVNSGTGVFTPSVAGLGTKTLLYSYTNVFSCTALMTKNIIVQTSPFFICGNFLTDIRDNKVYPTIQIGTQCWMQKNLNYGNAIQGTSDQTDNCVNEKYCYNDDAVNCTLYGGLYQWDEVMAYSNTPSSKGLCPPGWHIPTQAEWMTLFNANLTQGMAGKPLQDSIFNGYKAKESGVDYSNITWKFQGFAAIFWSSNSYGLIKALSHGMNLQNFGVSDYYSNRSNAFALRCIHD